MNSEKPEKEQRKWSECEACSGFRIIVGRIPGTFFCRGDFHVNMDIAFQDAEILPLQELRARGLRLPGSQTSGQPPDPELEKKGWELGALG